MSGNIVDELPLTLPINLAWAIQVLSMIWTQSFFFIATHFKKLWLWFMSKITFLSSQIRLSDAHLKLCKNDYDIFMTGAIARVSTIVQIASHQENSPFFTQKGHTCDWHTSSILWIRARKAVLGWHLKTTCHCWLIRRWSTIQGFKDSLSIVQSPSPIPLIGHWVFHSKTANVFYF